MSKGSDGTDSIKLDRVFISRVAEGILGNIFNVKDNFQNFLETHHCKSIEVY